MLPGLLPFSRATLMMNVVAIGMAVIVPVLLWSVYLVRVRRNLALHRRVQIALGVTLLIVVVAFEVDVRVFGWRHLAQESRFYDSGLFPVLYGHLFFSVTTTLLWIYALIDGLRRFDNPPAPNARSAWHRRLGWATVVFTICTSVTGWLFYYMAFMA